MTGVDNMISVYNSAEQGSMTKNILSNMLRNLKNVRKMNIYDMADACYVSPASVSRMIRKLGYKNYSYFQKDITDCVNKYEHHNRIISMDQVKENADVKEVFFDTLERLLSSMRTTLDRERLSELAATIHESNKIRLYAFEVSFSENFLQYDLFMSGKECEVYRYIHDMRADVADLTQDDLVIMVAPKQIEGMDVDEIVTEVKKRGTTTCLVTDSKRFSALKKADFQFAFEGEMRAIDAFILQSFLCLLTMEYRRLYIDV